MQLNNTDNNVLFLCVGTPTPDRQGFGSSSLIETGSVRLMVDCGPAAVWKLAAKGYLPTDIDVLFLTHLHFDHCSDLPCYLLAFWDQNVDNAKKATLVGPPELPEMINRLIGRRGAFSRDILARINAPISIKTYMNRGGSIPRKWPEAKVISADQRSEFQYAHVHVQIKETKHVEPYLRSYAYRFNFNDRCVVFTGDTGAVDCMADLAKGCDLLVANCWNAKADIRDEKSAEAFARVEEAAEMAVKSGSKALCLNHIGFRSGQDGVLETDLIKGIVARQFNGQLYLAHEGLVINL